MVLQPARGGRESHQGSQQRCRLDGASVKPLDDECQLVPDRHAGLQPELLAAAVQPRGKRRGGNLEAHHAGHGAPALPVSGRPHLAPCRQGRRQLQRPLPGEGRLSTTHGPSAQGGSRAGWICSSPSRAARCLIRYRESRIAFYAQCRSTVSSTYLSALEKSEPGRIRGSSCSETSAAQHIRHLPYVQTVHNSGANNPPASVIPRKFLILIEYSSERL